jgi:hypothetical protein|tara:strand:- start:871 stop:1017 length:147 start_codon:yes stop_codon:yes gene_type:complete
MWCADNLVAITSEVTIAEVIAEDDDEIGSSVCRALDVRIREGEEQKKS